MPVKSQSTRILNQSSKSYLTRSSLTILRMATTSKDSSTGPKKKDLDFKPSRKLEAVQLSKRRLIHGESGMLKRDFNTVLSRVLTSTSKRILKRLDKNFQGHSTLSKVLLWTVCQLLVTTLEVEKCSCHRLSRVQES